MISFETPSLAQFLTFQRCQFLSYDVYICVVTRRIFVFDKTEATIHINIFKRMFAFWKKCLLMVMMITVNFEIHGKCSKNVWLFA